jgi:uncharacterized Zn finger protein
MSWYQWKPYVPVRVRRDQAREKIQKLRKKGLEIQPVVIEGRTIARTFWGQAWCDHLEKFSDFANRLPRGRTYVRNGSVCHLEIAEGEIKAMVCGSRLYNVRVAIKNLPRKKWNDLKERCAGQIGSLLELLQGKLSKQVMAVMTERDRGLFPLPGEITLRCDCPDWAVMCKHVAAVLYGVGARLDKKPELLFVLRGVDHEELISAEAGQVAAGMAAAATAGDTGGGGRHLASGDLAEVFGIEMAPEPSAARASSPAAAPAPSDSLRPRGPAALTGASVKRLRSRLNMSQSQFARLLGVSAPSVGNWERTKGRLHLQARTRDALRAAGRLTVQEACQRLDGA